MNKTYVTIIRYGSYDDKDFLILYVGNDYEKSQVIPENWAKNGEVTSITIEHWVDGKKETEKEMQYFSMEGYVLSKD